MTRSGRLELGPRNWNAPGFWPALPASTIFPALAELLTPGELLLAHINRWDIRHREGTGSWQGRLPLEGGAPGEGATIEA